MAERHRVEATIALQNLARALVRFRHQPLDPLGLLLRLDDAHGQPGIVHDGQDRVVSDLGFLHFRHLAVIAGGFGRLTVGAERVPHGLGQDLQRHAVLLTLDGRRRMAQQMAGHVDPLARPIDQHDPSRTRRIRLLMASR